MSKKRNINEDEEEVEENVVEEEEDKKIKLDSSILKEEEPPTPLSIDEMISVGMTEPIVIDGIPFRLLGKITGLNEIGQVETTTDGIFFDNYQKVAILSGEPGDIENRALFWVYSSQSELGMWRLCYTYRRPDRRLQYDKLTNIPGNLKGTGDYVQTTLIHIELQHFINENIGRLVFYNGPSGVFYGRLTKTTTPYDFPYFDSADGPTIRCPVFNNEKYKGVNPLGREIKSPGNVAPFGYMTRDSKTICGLPFTDNIKAALLKFSDSFSNSYRIELSTNTLIYENYTASVIDTDLSQKQFIGDIYSVNLTTSKKVSEDFKQIKIIYFRTRTINGFDVEFTKNYYMTITILPSRAVCNKYGLYSQYIFAGMYVCKLLEYKVQCLPEEVAGNPCTGTYVFVGDRYQNINGDYLFPYNIIQSVLSPPPPTPPEEEEPTPRFGEETPTQTIGGGSRKTKRNKRKSKRVTRNKRKTHRSSRRCRRR
jgi:hypothetical protein